MRPAVIQNKGSAMLIMLFAMPFMVVLMALVVDGGRVLLAKARLEIAADRSALAGAGVLAHALNEVTASNLKIHDAAEKLIDDFSRGSEQSLASAQNHYRSYENKKDAELETIGEVLGKTEQRARLVASKTFLANAPQGEAQIGFVERPRILSNLKPDQHKFARYDNVTGSIVYDPTGREGDVFDVLEFLVKDSSRDGIVNVTAKEEIKPMLIGGFVGDSLTIRAEASAAAFGGSVENFKFYRVALVPTP